MSEEIEGDRKLLCVTAAMIVAAAQLGVIGSARGQSRKTTPADLPATKVQQTTPAVVRLPIEGELSSLGNATGWLNSEPLTVAGLRS